MADVKWNMENGKCPEMGDQPKAEDTEYGKCEMENGKSSQVADQPQTEIKAESSKTEMGEIETRYFVVIRFASFFVIQLSAWRRRKRRMGEGAKW
ncbi:MAG: hypothetical protein C4539_06565 [Ignavibacteriales bacterium]|nr:MAG: hypothetical protein C4539_06565 [Ignavibacteriales bacterium]